MSFLYGKLLDDLARPVGSDIRVSLKASTANPAVASLPSGPVFFWYGLSNRAFRLYRPDGRPGGEAVEVGPGWIYGDVAARPGGFVAAWWGFADGDNFARFYDFSGIPAGDAPFVTSDVFLPASIAVMPSGDFVIAGFSSAAKSSIGASRADGTPAARTSPSIPGRRTITRTPSSRSTRTATSTWPGAPSTATPVTPAARARLRRRRSTARADERPRHDVGARHRRRPHRGSRFVVTWACRASATVVSLCAPGASMCGDGTVHPQCEQCDDGAANSNATPDACRADCTRPRCGDGVVDGGEECDDGNLESCDGCSMHCVSEPGLVCGDGISNAACGQLCDDANAVVGDEVQRLHARAHPGRRLGSERLSHRVAGRQPDEHALLDKRGAISRQQRCLDDDLACDFDGGIPGSCTFHVRACANNPDLAACQPGTRLSSWELRTPSANKAAKDPLMAAVRASFLGVVPGTLVGPSAPDVCTGDIDVAVPLKGVTREGKLKLGARATLYDGRRDQDALQLVCLPSG